MKISIFASIGAQNLGDELILKNEIHLLENKYGKNTEFFVFSYNPKNPFFKQQNIKYIEYFPVGIKKLKNILKNIFNFLMFLRIVIKSDLLIIGGGGIIYDSEIQTTKNPLNTWIFRTKIFRLCKKKFEFFAVGINIKNKKNLEKVKKIFYGANIVTVRDKYSKDLLKKIGIESQQLLDPVFYDNFSENNIQKNSYLIKNIDSKFFDFRYLQDLNIEGKIVGIAFRGGYLNNNGSKLDARMEEGKINEIINFVLRNNGKVVLLPHSFHENDKLANDYLFLKKFVKKDQKIMICESINDVYEVYKCQKVDFCLSMRLHSIILSQVYHIQFVGISYSTKTDEVLNYIEKNYN